MLVFGETVQRVSFGEKLEALAGAIARHRAACSGIVAHALLVDGFLEAAELAQGVADAEFERHGFDSNPEPERIAGSLLSALCRAVLRSWRSGFAPDCPPQPDLEAGLVLARGLDGQSAVVCKPGEGYAFYALYPEAYLAAGATLPPDTTFVGIRSIGLGLAALAAVAVGAPAPVSVRPFGHPFRRQVALSPELAASLLARTGPLAVVDEGPGLSGSSFGAVADFLEDRGVPPERIHFLPSHAGDLGPNASPRHRARWRTARRHVVDFDELVVRADDPAHRLSTWVEDLTGPSLEPPQDISGGQWRARRFGGRDWPPVHAQQERRKFLLGSASGTWLLKFVGLGGIGEAKLRRARQLHAAGLAPEPHGFRHGFLVERWLGDAAPIWAAEIDRAALLRRLARYLAFRARHFPRDRGHGASLEALLDMAVTNAGEALGADSAAPLNEWRRRLPALERVNRPIEVDGRMHAWEWLRLGDGRLLKTDALDHHAAHDIVGCQDVAWDIAGAVVEFGLSASEQDELTAMVRRFGGAPLDPALTAFLLRCYAAFQLGYWTMAEATAAPDETGRIRKRAAVYAADLRQRIAADY